MRGAVFVALAATIGNLLQGWDNSTIAGSILYIKKEFNLQSQPTLEGLIVAMSIVGGTLITTISGPVSDSLGRRPMLIISSVLYFFSGLVMVWAPNVYVLLLARLLDGFGIGLAITIIPVYISETAPSEIRGQLNTIPQFCCSGGMFLSYCMVFGMSLMNSPSWRLMLGILSIPSLVYISLTVFFLPESPRWLVSKGQMLEAKQVLQRLSGREDVSAELALLVEGLGVGRETSIEEYIISPANDLTDDHEKEDHIKLYGPEEGLSWVAKPVIGQSTLGLVPRQGSSANRSVPLMDPVVTLFGSVHENHSDMGSMLFSNTGSMLSVAGHQGKNEHWDVESQKDAGDYASDAAGGDSDDNLRSPLLSLQTTSMEKDVPHPSNSSKLSMRRSSSLMQENAGEQAMGIGGGWQLAWKWSERIGEDGKKEGGFQRMYLHQECSIGSQRGSVLSDHGADIPEVREFVQAAALVSQPALYSKDLMHQCAARPTMAHPSETASKGPSWNDLFEPGVKRALMVGVGLQILQQVAGINGVLYYSPQILEQAGVAVLLSNVGIGSDSASLLMSALSTLFMLPCIALSMRLMDVAGRRSLMLVTIPILVVALLALVLSSVVSMAFIIQATISTAGVMVYLSCFVMGFGVIPNILCSEIFPTRVRGLCITICSLTYWIGNIIVTYSTPVLLNTIGLNGVFTIYAIGCIISWIFVFLKVPETKGMPLEVISEFFAMGGKQAEDAAKNN